MEHKRRRSAVSLTLTLLPATVLLMGVAAAGVSAAPLPADGAVLVVHQQELDFGQVVVGGTSTAQAVNISNSGTEDVPLSIAQVPLFPFTSNCPATLAPRASCALLVTYAPTEAGFQAGTLVIGSEDVFLLGHAAPPLTGTYLLTTPGAVDFGPLVVGNGTGWTIDVRNYGSLPAGPLTITGPTNPDFGIIASNCGATVGAGATCTLTVEYSPTAVGVTSSSLTIAIPGYTSIIELEGFGRPELAAPDQAYTTAVGAPYVVSDPALGFIGLSSGYAVEYDGASQPAHGTVDDNGDGTWSYTPDPGFIGVDTFDYALFDYYSDAKGTVTITVVAPLAATGAAPMPVLLGGAALLLAGIAVLLVRRRRTV